MWFYEMIKSKVWGADLAAIFSIVKRGKQYVKRCKTTKTLPIFMGEPFNGADRRGAGHRMPNHF